MLYVMNSVVLILLKVAKVFLMSKFFSPRYVRTSSVVCVQDNELREFWKKDAEKAFLS